MRRPSSVHSGAPPGPPPECAPLPSDDLPPVRSGGRAARPPPIAPLRPRTHSRRSRPSARYRAAVEGAIVTIEKTDALGGPSDLNEERGGGHDEAHGRSEGRERLLLEPGAVGGRGDPAGGRPAQGRGGREVREGPLPAALRHRPGARRDLPH